MHYDRSHAPVVAIKTTEVALVLFKISHGITGICWAVVSAMLWRVRKYPGFHGGCEAVVVMMAVMAAASFCRVFGILMMEWPMIAGVITSTTLVAAAVVCKALIELRENMDKGRINLDVSASVVQSLIKVAVPTDAAADVIAGQKQADADANEKSTK